MLASAALLWLAAPAAAADAEPVSLFKSACFTGEIHLDRAQLQGVDYKHLPHSAKVAVGRSIFRGAGFDRFPPEPPQATMPNAIYKIGGKQIYLIEPTPEAMPGIRFADSCVVVWKGDSFDDARKLVQPGPLNQGVATAHRAGVGYVSVNDGQRVFTAALFDNWTVLRSAPASSEPSVMNLLPGARRH